MKKLIRDIIMNLPNSTDFVEMYLDAIYQKNDNTRPKHVQKLIAEMYRIFGIVKQYRVETEFNSNCNYFIMSTLFSPESERLEIYNEMKQLNISNINMLDLALSIDID